MHFLARFRNETNWSTGLRLLSSAKELTEHLRIVDEGDRRFAESGFAGCEAWAGPVEYATLECERGADGARGVLDGERLALDVEVSRHVAVVDTQQLAAANIVLASFGWVGGRIAVQRYP